MKIDRSFSCIMSMHASSMRVSQRFDARHAGDGDDCLIITMPPPEVVAQWDSE